MKQTQVFINSKNRTSGSSSDFKVRLSQSIQNIQSISIKSLEIPFSWYTVNESNNQLCFVSFADQSKPIDFTVTISPGNYSADELQIELETKMNEILAGFTVSYSDNKLKYTITHPSFFIIKYTESTCKLLIGLGLSDSTINTSWTSENVIQLTGTNHLFLESKTLCSSRPLAHSDEFRRPIFVKVSVQENPGSILTRLSKDDDVHCYDSQYSIQELDFRLVDDQYHKIDLNGLDWSIELLVCSHQD